MVTRFEALIDRLLARRGAVPLALLALTALAHANGLGNGFVWDDEYVLLRNESLRDLANLPRVFYDARTTASYESLRTYRPLRAVLYAAGYRLWGLDPLGFHLLNLVVHGLNVILVWLVFARLAGDRRTGAVVALIFAVHPLQTEAVANVTGLTDLLWFFFGLLALAAHLRLATTRGPRRALLVGGIYLALAAALLSKETAIALPLLMLLCHWLAPRPATGPDPVAPRVLYAAGLVALVLGFVWLRLSVVPLGDGEYPGATLARTMLMQAKVLARYLQLIVLPLGQSVRHTVSIPLSLIDGASLAAAALVLALVGLALWRRRRDPLLTLGLGWFFVALGPVMNLVPLPGSMIGERFCYPALPGIVLAAIALARPLARRWPGPRGWTVLLLLVTVSLVGLTLRRNRVWHDNLSVFEDALRGSPDSNAVRLNLVRAYQQMGRHEQAARHYRAAQRNTRRQWRRYRQLGDRAFAAGWGGEARIWYRRALRMNPADPHARARLEALSRR